MSIHGIRTHAEWQHTLGEVLNDEGLHFRHKRFGYYLLTSFIRPARNQHHVDEFFTYYGEQIHHHPSVDLNNPTKRPSVIAHSFGSFVIGYAMLKYPEIKFDKVILCGSILPRDFDWHRLFVRDQVGRVRNECGGKDIWVWLAPFAVRGTGRSGRYGFDFIGSRCANDPHTYHRHSDYFHPHHIRHTWLPFLRTPPSGFATLPGGDIDSEDDYRKCIHRTRAIDRVRFSSLPAHQSVAIPYGYSKKWRAINPSIYTFLISRASRKVCGYINAMPLEDYAFEGVTSGKMLDNLIPAEAIVPYARDQEIRIYVMSVAIAPNISRAGDGLFSEPLEVMLDAFFGQLRALAERRIRVREVAAIGWTSEGKRMCERLFAMKQTGKLQLLAKDAVGNDRAIEYPIYKSRLDIADIGEPARMHRGLRKLMDLYKSM